MMAKLGNKKVQKKTKTTKKVSQKKTTKKNANKKTKEGNKKRAIKILYKMAKRGDKIYNWFK